MAWAVVALLVAVAAVAFIVIDRRMGSTTQEFRVPGHPTGLVVADGRVWVAAPRSGTVTVLDASTGRRLGRPLATGGTPARLAVGASGIWVADSAAGAVIPVRREPPRAYPPIRLGADVSDVALAGRAVWAISSAEGVVRIVQPGDVPVRTVPVGRSPVDIDADDRRVVVASAGDGTLTWFDAQTRRLLHPARRVAVEPVAVALSGDAAWVADARRGTVTRVDARTGRPSSPAVVVCARPLAVDAEAEDVYVVCGQDRNVVRLRADDLTVDWRHAAGADPAAVAVESNGVWVADAGGDKVVSLEP